MVLVSHATCNAVEGKETNEQCKTMSAWTRKGKTACLHPWAWIAVLKVERNAPVHKILKNWNESVDWRRRWFVENTLEKKYIQYRDLCY